MARILSEQEEFDKALLVYDKLITLNPDDKFIFMYKGYY